MDPTERLISDLSGRLEPVRRLRPPAVRALGWILLGAALVVLLAWLEGLRADLPIMLRDPAYLVQLAGAWATGTAATLAAFIVSLPDRPRLWMALPLPSLGLWLSGFAYGCLAHWIAVPAGAPILDDSLHCLETILMASLPLGLVLWVMLRRAKPLRPGSTAWLAGLAVAGFADTAHLLIHVVEASALVLVINLVPICLIIFSLWFAGRRGLEPAV